MIIHLDHTLETASDDRRHPPEVTVSGVRGRAGLERHRRWERTLAVVVAASLIVAGSWWASVYLTTSPAPPPPSPSAQRDPNPAILPLHPDGRFIDPGPFDDAVIFARCAIDVEGVRYPAGGVVSDVDDRPCYLGYDKAPQQVMPTWPMDDATITEVCSATAGYDLSGFTLLGRESSEVGGMSEVAVFESTNDFVALCRLVEAQEPNRVSIVATKWYATPPWSEWLRARIIEDGANRYVQVQGAAVMSASQGVDPLATRMTLTLADGSAPIAVDIHNGWIVADRAVQVPPSTTPAALDNCSWTASGPGIEPVTFPCD